MIELKDLCQKASSNIAQKDLEGHVGKYPIYGASGLIGYVDFYKQEDPYVAVVKDGAGIGRVMRLPAKSSVIGTMQYILPKDGVDVQYLAFAMENMNLAKYFSGATIPHIYFKDYCTEKLPEHSEEEQKQIAEVIGKVTALISLRKQQLAKLDELVKARFVEMFGDCHSNPKNWNTKKLEDVASVGSSKRVFVEELQDDGIPFYRGTEIGTLAERKTISSELFITEEHYNQLCAMSGKPQKGDLLMPSICPDGRIWIVDTDAPFYFKDGRVLWVHLTSADYNSMFLLYTLKDRIMKDYDSIASGTTFAELKIFSLKKCRVFDVPIALQNEFADFVECVDQQKQTVQQSLEKLELMKKALMQECFG